MLSRSLSIASKRRAGVPATTGRPPVLIRAVILIWLCITLLVLGVTVVPRVGTTTHLFDLTQGDLPGSPLPDDVMCSTGVDEYSPRCFVRRFGNDIYFNFDRDRTTILRTIIPAQKYTIGSLILGWGRPTGIQQTPYSVNVYWGTRSALLYTPELRPDSRVEFILYDPQPIPASPWQGFKGHTNVIAGTVTPPRIRIDNIFPPGLTRTLTDNLASQ